MTPTIIPGFLTKKEVEEKYGRSHRSLTRDFSAAVRRGDAKILSHLKLQTEDGHVRAGADVTLDQIQEWSNRGLSPTWYVEGEWAARRYGVRAEALPDRSVPKSDDAPFTTAESHAGRGELHDLVRRLDEQIQDLRQEMKIKNEQIQQANDRTRESNVLMKELQTLLGNVQDRLLLPWPAQATPDKTQTVAIVNREAKSPTPHSGRTSTATTSKPRPRSDTGNVGSKSKTTTTKSTAVLTVEKPKWYELPTLTRILRRRSP